MKIILFSVLLFVSAMLMAQVLVINEVMSSNASTIYDEESDTPDWIELYNASANSIEINNFGISDDNSNLFKWTFPNISIDSKEHLLIFASDKNHRFSHLETIIDWGADWKYFLGFAEPPANWREIDFDDSLWLSGPTGIGRGDGDDATVIPMVMSYFMRHNFTISDTSNIIYGMLHVDYDDAFVAYVNGTEIARANIGTPGIIPAYNHFAEESHEAQIYDGGLPDPFLVFDLKNLLEIGDNVLCIQTHNINPNSGDLSIIPFLTLVLNETPPNPVGLAEILEPLRPHQHTNFKISSEGETLYLVDDTGAMLDSLETGEIPTDISRGHQPDGTGSIFYFAEPTPADSNYTYGYQVIAEPPVFDVEGGFFTDSVEITLSGNQADEIIYYTVDGADPSDTSFVYADPILIDSTSVIRARIVGYNSLPSNIITHTYFIDVNHTLPVVSISTTPANFFDWETGIYVLGPNASPIYPYHNANFWQDWERPVNIEFFDENGQLGFSKKAGVKIFGGWSRGKPQKSLAIFARNQYEPGNFEYQIFAEKPITEFKTLILRNSGNDWCDSHYRDAMTTGLIKSTGLDYQEYQPVVVYINGVYWGILNLREKVNEHFIEANHDVNCVNIDLIDMMGEVYCGDAIHYNNMMDFVENNDLSDSTNYEYLNTLIDINNFISYEITEIYAANTDWPVRNNKFWREKVAEGKWKWILFDTDFGFGMAHSASHNTLEFALEPNGPPSPNPPCSTLLLRKLIQNTNFRNKFINRFADFMNTIFRPEVIIDRIDMIHDLIEPEIPAHYSLWEVDLEIWEDQVMCMSTFANERPQHIIEYLINEFDLEGTADINLDVNQDNIGNIKINTLELVEYPWSGNYFEEVPVLLQAFPAPGYEFIEWTGDFASTDDSVSVSLIGSMSITAVFAEAGFAPSPIVINEINYNSCNNFNPDDWVEIYNNSGITMDLSNWQFKDEDDLHVFSFPVGLTLPANSYYVLCRDTLAFHTLFDDVDNYLGNWDFGLNSNGDMARIFDEQGILIDEVSYDNEVPWPLEPDGNGSTLSLKNPGMNNLLAQNWAASEEYGTPGLINDVFVHSDEQLPEIADKLILYQNFPNPFNPVTMIKYSLPEDSNVILRIYNVKGQLTKSLIDEFQMKGTHSTIWNGTNTNEKPVANGLYFYQLISKNRVINRKMLLLK